jgi:hypothetical protein
MLDAVIDTNPFARAALGWLKGRARSLDVCGKDRPLARGFGLLDRPLHKSAHTHHGLKKEKEQNESTRLTHEIPDTP